MKLTVDSGVVVFLQNAWSPAYAGGEWPREYWLPALARSRSGQRLRRLVDDPKCCWNTTPIVGAEPSSVVPPNDDHVQKVLGDVDPVVVVACGRQAESCLSSAWDGHLIVIPHPTSRVLTNALLERARVKVTAVLKAADSLKRDGRIVRLALRQRRGWVEQEDL